MTHTKYQSCLLACSTCAIVCMDCHSDCLNEHDLKMLRRCIRLTDDCTAICLLAIKAMASDSEFANQICKLCAEICTACADECEKHNHMEHCKKCSEICSNCAQECLKMTN